MAQPLPGKDVPLLDLKTGLINDAWYDFFKFHQKLVQLPDVSPIAPTNGQVLIWNNTTKLWTPGTN